MFNAFALDLRLVRRKSGLTQKDCAHLLAVHRSKITRLEKGEIRPNASDIVFLSLIFGKSFETLCPEVFEQAAGDLEERLKTLPVPSGHWMGRFNRTNTLGALNQRLDGILTKRP